MNLRLQPCLLAVTLAVLTAPSAHAVTSKQLSELTDASLDGLLARQLPWGGFDDPLAGPRFNYGAVALGWLAAERADPGLAGDPRRRAADASLLAATRVAEPGAFQVWIEALALHRLSASRLAPTSHSALAGHLQAFTAAHDGGGRRGVFGRSALLQQSQARRCRRDARGWHGPASAPHVRPRPCSRPAGS